MKGREWFESYREDILKTIVLIGFFIGAIVFGKLVWGIEFDVQWKKWLALVLGELSFLYSATFTITGILVVAFCFQEKTDRRIGVYSGIVAILLAVAFQCIFWGVVYANKNLLTAVAILGVLVMALLSCVYRACRK